MGYDDRVCDFGIYSSIESSSKRREEKNVLFPSDNHREMYLSNSVHLF